MLSFFFAIGFALLALICTAAMLILPAFEGITIWQVLEYITESPFLLPPQQRVGVWISYFVGVCFFVAIFLLHRKLAKSFRLRFGNKGIIVLNLSFLIFFAEALYATLGLLDSYLGLLYEYRCIWCPSKIFREYYVACDAKKIQFHNKRNLIVIMGESIEDSFIDGMAFGKNLMPRLMNFHKDHDDFGQMQTVHGCDHTICSLFGITYGTPRLQISASPCSVSFSDYPEVFMPSTWNVWVENDFNCRFIQGGELGFACTDKVFRSIPEVVIHDSSYFDKDPDYLKEPQKNSFGVNDEVVIVKHLRQETLDLANENKPFVLVVWTLNTHCSGWRSAFKPQKHNNLLADSVMQADDMIVDYLEWLEQQSFIENTDVVFVGDHIAHTSFSTINRENRHPANILMSSKVSKIKNKHVFAAFDLAPTFLELTGAILPDHRFGIGTSLLSDRKTLLERIGRSRYESEIRACGADYRKIALGVNSESER